jgi:chitinase
LVTTVNSPQEFRKIRIGATLSESNRGPVLCRGANGDITGTLGTRGAVSNSSCRRESESKSIQGDPSSKVAEQVCLRQINKKNSVALPSAFLLVLAGLFCGSVMSAEGRSVPRPMIVAYVFPQDNPLREGEIAAQKLTRINYAFANIKEGRIVNGFAFDDRNLASLVALKQHNPSLTVLISVGGWLWSGAFSDMAISTQSRAVFISSVVEFVSRHQLDGVDIDWEYPGLPGAESHFRAEDKQNYTLLLKQLRTRFNGLERQLHRHLYVTVAAGSSPEFLSHTEMNKVQQYLDSINLMAYDYYEPDSDSITGHHAPLHTNPADPKNMSAENSVKEYEQAGVSVAKIVLGVPFYAHVWGQVPDVNHGLFQPGKEIPHSYAVYGGGPEAMLRNGFVRYWDPVSAAPYLYSAEKQVFASYDDPESLALKCKFVLARRLMGIMFWTYETDTTGTLLDAVNDGLVNSPGSQSGVK